MITTSKITTTDVKRYNKNRIFQLIYTTGKISRQEIADVLQLSLPTVNQNLKILFEKNLLIYEGNFESTGGRKAQAIQSIEENNLGMDRVLVVYLPDCHESLAGIIAGRIREAYNKPVFVLTKGADGVKGSGRSIEAYSMYEELVKCSDLLTQFGGHPMAAGLSMEEKNVELFRRRLNDNCTLTEQDLIPKIMIDVPMPISYLSKKLTEQLKVLEPFGKGNSKPLFAQKNLRAVGIRVLGRNRNVAKMLLIDENGIKMDAVYFGEAQEFVDFVQAHDTISVTYYPEINVFQGRENLQVVIKNYC